MVSMSVAVIHTAAVTSLPIIISCQVTEGPGAGGHQPPASFVTSGSLGRKLQVF